MATVFRKTVGLIIMLTAFSKPSIAQHQDAQLLVYNTLLGAVTASIGAVINKRPGTSCKHVIARAAWQGSLGGALRYSAKKTLYLITEKQEPAYGLPAMILQNAGNSIVNNAAYNRPFLRSWNIDYGFFRFDFDIGSNAQPARVRLLPAAVYGVCLTAGQGRVSWAASLATGCPIFETREDLTANGAKLDVIAGLSYGRAIIVNPKYTTNRLQTVAHELVHYFQYSDYLVCNTWLSTPAKRVAPRWLEKLADKYVYCDFPYSSIPYALEGFHPIPNYYNNFFEFEAERFSTNAEVQ